MRSANKTAPDGERWRKRLGWPLLAATAGAILIVPYLAVEAQLDTWGAALLAATRAHPLAAALLIVSLLAGDVLLPVPSSAINALAGALFGWAAGAALIWVGLGLGCLLGYALGAGGARPLAKHLVGDAELARAIGRFGPAVSVSLVLTRAVPVLAEAGTLAAGAAGMPIGRYLLITGLANAGVALVYAGVGAAALNANSFLLAFAAAAGLPALAWAAWRLSAGARPRSRPQP